MPRTGTGRVYQRGNVWWIDYGFRGDRHRESSGSTKKADATKLLRKRLGEMSTGKLIGPSEERVTFEELADAIRNDYQVNRRRSTKRLETSLGHLGEFFSGNRAVDITTDRIRRYIVHRQDEGAANASIQKELAALKRAFNLAVQDGMLSNKPHVPSVKVNNTRQGFFSPGELEALVKELPAPLRPVVRFAALTGWRKGEVLGLQWADVDFEAGEVRLWASKNDEPRVFPFRLLPPLEQLLEEQRERTRKVEKATGGIVAQVFHRDGQPIKSMRGAWNEACKRAGLEGWLFHDLRRTAVRTLEAAGVSRSVAMKLTGHKTESVYRRYAITDKASLEAGVEKLAKVHGAAPAPSKVVPIGKAAEG